MDPKPPFEQIVTDHALTVLRVCRAVAGQQDGEDAWSDTFLAALRAYPSLPATANVEAWLVTIARNKSIDTRRAHARSPLPVADIPDLPSAIGSPDTALEESELWRLVGHLPEKQRKVITLRYLGGLSHTDIAGVVGGSPEAARRAATDGIKNLRSSYPFLPDGDHEGARP